MTSANLGQNKQIALEFFRALTYREAEKLDRLLADDLEWWILGNLGLSGLKTKETFKQAVQLLWDLMEGVATINMEYVTAEDDRVALIGKGDMVTKNGKPYRNDYNIMLVIRNGQIVKGREFFDTQLVSKVFGV
jgi:ketosteroid isomerase-like protein